MRTHCPTLQAGGLPQTGVSRCKPGRGMQWEGGGELLHSGENFLIFFEDFIYLLLERGEGREKHW